MVHAPATLTTSGAPVPATRTAPELVTVSFCLPAGFAARYAELIAEFTLWAPLAMDRRPDGSHAVTVRLERDGRWRYQFVLDGATIVNDPGAALHDVSETGEISVLET